MNEDVGRNIGMEKDVLEKIQYGVLKRFSMEF